MNSIHLINAAHQDTFQYFLLTYLPNLQAKDENYEMLKSNSQTKNSSMALLDLQLSYDVNSFFGRFQKCLLLTKKQIKNILLASSLEAVLSEKTKIQNLIDRLYNLCLDTKIVLQTGITDCYRFIVKTEESLKQQKQINQVQIYELFCKLDRIFQALLHFTIIYKEFKQRRRQHKNLDDISSFSSRVLQLFPHGQNLQQSRSQMIDQNLLEAMQRQISKQQISQHIKSYARCQQEKIQCIKQICRICQCRIKIDSIQQHVKYCTKKHKQLKKLDSNTQELNELTHKIKQRQIELTKQLKKKKKIVCFQDSTPKHKSQKTIFSQFQNQQTNQCITTTQTEIQQESLMDNFNLKILLQLYKRIGKYMSMFHIRRRNSFVSSREQKSQVNQIKQKLNDMGNKFLNQEQILKQFSQCFSKRIEIQYNLKKIQCQYFKNIDCESRNTSSIQSFNSSFADGFKDPNKNQKQTKKSFFAAVKNEKSQISANFQENKHFQVNTPPSQNSLKSMLIRRPQKKNSYYQKEKQQVDDDFYLSQQRQWNSQKCIKTDHQSKNVSFKDFRILKFLGKGAFGKVYLVRRFLTNDNYAMKVVKINQVGFDHKKKIEDISNQHDIFRKISGDFLVKAAFSFTEGNIHMFFLEYMKGGDFSQLLQNEVYLEQQTAKFYIAQIVLAIEHLHKLNIIHRDLKPQNLVLDEKGHLKLTDFGLSKEGINKKIQKTQEQNLNNTNNKNTNNKTKLNKRRTLLETNKQKIKIIGTPDYIAPQIITRTSVDNDTIDWWSLGVLVYEILVGQKPFGAQTIQKVFQNIINLQIQWPPIGYQEGMMTPEAQDLIKKLLDIDYHTRLGAKGANQIKTHPFFEGVNWFTLKNEKAPIMRPSTNDTNGYMQEDLQLRKQIQQMMGKVQSGNTPKSKLNLDNLVRFDLLSEQTLKSSEVTKQKKVEQLLNKQKQIVSIRGVVCKLIKKESILQEINE